MRIWSVGSIVLLSTALLSSGLAHASEIRGRVVNVVGGETLARVQVIILETGAGAVTGSDGTFEIPAVAPGNYTLRLNAVGFRLSTIPFSLAEDEIREFDVTLAPDNFRHIEKVEVKGDIFQGSDSPALVETNLTAPELRETSTVLADDPFRAVQALPGVSASGNNDFFAQLTVMGAPYLDVSAYIDGILIPQPFHGITDLTQGATLSLLTSETVEDVKLLPVAYPEKYGDAVGAALDITTRDGSQTAPTFRVSAGVADSELLGEGELGHQRRGSWMASARKSYLGYLVSSRLNEPYTDVSFYDGALKLNYKLTPSQTVTLYGLGGHTKANFLNPRSTLQAGEIQRATNDLEFGRAGWNWTVNPHLAVEARAAYVSSPLREWDVNNTLLDDSRDREWVAGGRVVLAWRADQVFEGGWTTRRVSGGFTSVAGTGEVFDTIRSGWRNDGYVQQASSFFGDRLHLVGSLRVDTASEFDVHPVSPQFSTALQVSPSNTLQFGVGRYNQFQFPAFAISDSPCTPDEAVLQTANHFTAGVEHRMGEHTRIRAMFFDRQNQNQVALSGGCPPFPPPSGFHGDGQNYSRGVQFVLQSRTANRLSGWIGYTYTHARDRNLFSYEPGGPGTPVITFLSPEYPSLEDQLHTLNAFASYRVNPSVRVSAKFLYGSGFPIPSGSIDTAKTPPQLVGWNATRLGDYQRLDLRGEKEWAFRHWKLALYGEVLNLTNHYNPRYIAVGPGNSVVTEQGLPITPTAGVAFEF